MTRLWRIVICGPRPRLRLAPEQIFPQRLGKPIIIFASMLRLIFRLRRLCHISPDDK
jgi:hypothetical protein